MIPVLDLMTYPMTGLGLSGSPCWVHKTFSQDRRSGNLNAEIDVTTIPLTKVDIAAISTSFITSLKAWPVSGFTPSSATPAWPIFHPCSNDSREAVEHDSDATCVASEPELHEAVKAIATARRSSNNSAPSRKHSRLPSLAVNTSSPVRGTRQPNLNLSSSPKEYSSWKLNAFAQEEPVRKRTMDSGCCWDGRGFGCQWKEQVRRVQVEASKDKGMNGYLVHDLRMQLVRAEEEVKGLRYALCALQAETGLKDMHIRMAVEAKMQAEREREFWKVARSGTESINEGLKGKLQEREAEIVDQHVEILSLRRAVKGWDEKYTSFKGTAESEAEALKREVVQLRHEREAKGSRAFALTQEKEEMTALVSSLKLANSKHAASISELKRDLDQKTADLELKELRIQSISQVRKTHPDATYQSMKEAIAAKEERISDLNERLTECHRRLVRLSNASTTSAGQAARELALTELEADNPCRMQAPSPPPTTPAYDRLKELSTTFARVNSGECHSATVIFPMQRPKW